MAERKCHKKLKVSVNSSDDNALIAELVPETLFEAAPFDIIEYIRQFTGPEPIYEVSYSVNIPRANEAENSLFTKKGVNIFQPMYFKNAADAHTAKMYIRENHEYFGVKLNKFLTRAGPNNAIVINGEPHLIFKIPNMFNSYQDFEDRIVTPLEKIKRIRNSSGNSSSSSSDPEEEPVAGKTPMIMPMAQMSPTESQSEENENSISDFEDIDEDENEQNSLPPLPPPPQQQQNNDYMDFVMSLGNNGEPPTRSTWWQWDDKSKMWMYRPPW